MDAIMDAIRRGGENDYHDAFGRLTRVSRPCRERIDRIKNNDPDFVELTIQAGVANYFSELAWGLLGRYVAGNDYLESISIRTPLLTDATVASLFEGLAGGSRSVRKLALTNTAFGIASSKRLARFLKNSRLTMLEIRENEHALERREENERLCTGLCTECLRLILDALQGGPIESLRIQGCAKIDSIAAFEKCTLPNLRALNLDQNNIRSLPSFERYPNLERLSLEGNWMRRGYPTIARLLESESPPVKNLDLTFTGMGDPEAEMVAESLKGNTSLNYLRLEGNKIKDGGRRAFSKLLSNVSSIERTCASNHTIQWLELPRSFDLGVVTMFNHIDLAISINMAHAGKPHLASRAKIIHTQLNSNARMELSRLQRVDYCYNNLFPQIDPVLLPNVLSMVGNEHRQDELYRMLRGTVPELAALVDRKATLKERMEDNKSRIACLSTEFAREKSKLLAQYERSLAALTAVNLRQSAALAAENVELQKELESIG